jgi:hypothetical protein
MDPVTRLSGALQAALSDSRHEADVLQKAA